MTADADRTRFDGPLGLAFDRGFRRELAALRAKATLKQLLGQAPDYRWPYTAERVVRNAAALHLAVRRLTQADPSRLDELRDAARVAAQAWEGLAALEERTSRATALMNAAVGYELAGYQANAACLARASADASAWSAEPTFEGVASAFVQRLMLRVVTAAAELDRAPDDAASLDDAALLARMATAVGGRGLAAAARFFLSGEPQHLEQALAFLTLADKGFTDTGDTRRANLTANLRALVPSMQARSTWATLSDVVPSNLRWQRYLRVLARGLSPSVLDSRSVSELWPSQLAALAGGLLDPQANKVVKLPTSAGKTRVAELAIVHTLVTQLGARCLYVAPYRALVSEVQESFGNLFADLGYAASSMLGSYEEDLLDRLTLAEDQVLVLTPEKLDLVLRLAPEALQDIRLIVLDEGQIVGDATRGARYELLVTRLRRRLPAARVLLLSAVVPSQTLQDFAAWLHAGDDDVVESDWRPSIQRLARLEWRGTAGVLRYDPGGDDAVLDEYLPNLVRQRRYEYVHPETGRRRRPLFPEAGNKSQLAAALAYELAPQGPVLVFCTQTDWAQSVGNAIATRIELAARTGEPVPGVFQPVDRPRSYLVAYDWLGPEDPTTRLLALGIGVHHGRQPEAVRSAIEEDFRHRRLAMLAATTTLAQGVNLPVRTVIVHSCWRYDEESGQRARLPAREYWNIAGRAGRAGEETEGTIIHLVTTPLDNDDYQYYRQARRQVEPVISALFALLWDLVYSRISPEGVAAKLDAELLALLVEEAAGELDQQALEAIIGDSLVGVQARARRVEVPLTPLAQALAGGISRIASLVPDVEERRIYSSTGLRTTSCRAIAEHVQRRADRLRALLPTAGYGEVDELLRLLLEGLATVDEMQPRTAYAGSYPDLLGRWLQGLPVAETVETLNGQDASITPTETERVGRFIEEYFAYLLPWGISGYLRIASHLLGPGPLSPVAAGLGSLVKYGVPTLEAAWAMAAGVANRQTALLVANLYLRTRPDDTDPAAFRAWLGELNPEELVEEYGVPEAALADVSRAILRSAHSAALDRLDEGRPLLPLTVRMRAFRQSASILGRLRPGDELDVRRDYQSPYRNATLLQSQGQFLGYLRRSDGQALAPELDAGMHVDARLRSVGQDTAGRTLLEVEIQAKDQNESTTGLDR